MKRLIAITAFFAAILSTTPALALNVVTTLPDLAAIAKAVGGDAVEVTAMAAPNEDPHYVDPRPNLILKLNKADVLVTVGLELEDAWLKPLVKQSRNAKLNQGGDGLVVSAEHVELLEVPKGKVDRAEGDIHPGGNPHFYLDPRRATKISVALRDRFKSLDPDNAERYETNTRAFVTKLQKLVIAQRNRFKKLPADKRRVVTYHRSLVYVLDWLDLDAIETVEPKPGIPPNPSHVARVLKKMKASGVNVLVQEEYYPRKTSDTLAKLADGRVVVIQGGARFDEGQSYVAHVYQISEELFDALTK